MDEVWERAVEMALDGQTDCASARSLTLDGAVKCVQGRLPPPNLLEKFQRLEHLSIANVGVSSLEKFPRLHNLQKLILSDNRIAGGLEFLVDAGLESLRDLDLSNNRIQYLEDLVPLAQLKIVSLDLYECPVTRIKDYRSRVFGLIRSLKYLDKMDANENERPESDEEEEDEEDDEEDDPGSGEIDGEDPLAKLSNGRNSGGEDIHDVDEDEESDADEEIEILRVATGSNQASRHLLNGVGVDALIDSDEDEEDVEDDDLGEEIDEVGEDENVIEVHEIDDSDDEEDGVEEDDNDGEEEEVDDDDEEDAEVRSRVQLRSTGGEIDEHDQGEEEEDDDEDGEYEEEDGEDEDEDNGREFLIRPIGQVEEDGGGSELDPVNDEEEEEDDDDDDDAEEEVEDEEDQQQPSSSHPKRKRADDGSVVDVSKSAKYH